MSNEDHYQKMDHIFDISSKVEIISLFWSLLLAEIFFSDVTIKFAIICDLFTNLYVCKTERLQVDKINNCDDQNWIGFWQVQVQKR